jgi:hypothetical protein
MANCITSTAYTMQADIYSASVTQDQTGAVVKSWTYQKTIDCVARGVVRKGIGENSTTVEVNNYLNILKSLVKLRSSEPIAYNLRITNIKNSDGVIFLENQDPSSERYPDQPTIFEPKGSTPLLNFDGSVIEYETVLMRQEIQRFL